jgi:hypothetical protein
MNLDLGIMQMPIVHLGYSIKNLNFDFTFFIFEEINAFEHDII